jgi:hypothetical protein
VVFRLLEILTRCCPILWFSCGGVTSVAIKKPDPTAIPVESPSPNWLKGDHYSNSKQSKRHELRLAECLGGKRYSGSGNRRWSRYSRGNIPSSGRKVPGKRQSDDTEQGDVATPKFHFEHKFTRAQSMSVQLEWLDKVEEGAKRKLKDAGLIITFQDQQGRPIKEYVAVPLSVYLRLMQKVEQSDE